MDAYQIPPLLQEPVCHLGVVDSGLGTAAQLLDVHMTIFLSFSEFKAEAEYMNLETKNTKAGFLDFL